MAEDFTKVFTGEGVFEALWAAQRWCDENGISYAPASGRELPLGLMRGDYVIAKWKNLTLEERAGLHGTMTGDARCGPITITLKGGLANG